MASKWSERWSTVVDADLLGTPFGTTDTGRADFRSVPLSRLLTLSGAMFRDCDFTAADFSEMRLFQCQFVDCVFDRADFTNLGEHACRFERCSFIRTDWRIGAIGFRDHGQPKSLYTGCTFEKVRFAKTNFQDARFENSHFIGPLKGVDFNVCGFWSCRFSGLLDDVMFRGNYLLDSVRERNPPPTETGLHDTSFADAELSFIGLRDGCVLENIEMPRSGEAFVCDQARLMRERENLLASVSETAVHETLAFYLKVSSYSAEHQPQSIVSAGDLLECGPKLEPAARAVYALLQRFAVADGVHSVTVH